MKIINHKYFVLLLIALVFAAPGISAYIFYKHPLWINSNSNNKGILLTPPVLLPLAQQDKLKWKFIVWSKNDCSSDCIRQLDKLARVRLALGRRLYDVNQELLLGSDARELSLQQMKIFKDQDIDVVKLTKEQENIKIFDDNNTIFIANPSNYLVLSYKDVTNPSDIFHDIKQLLNTTNKVGK